MNIIISADSTADLPNEYIEANNIRILNMKYCLDGTTLDGSEKLSKQEFYKKMRAGSNVSTSQINEYDAKEYFENLLKEEKDVIHIAFSSELSGSTANLIKIAVELNQIYKNKVYIVDSLCGGSSQGILTLQACELVKEHTNAEDIVQILKTKVQHVCSLFTVDSLKYLRKGGRISKLSSLVGTLLNIKPIMYADEHGKLACKKKVLSRKKAINELAKIVAEKVTDKSYIFISHADAEADAKLLMAQIEDLTKVKPILTELTQILGCHAGPGLIAVFFISDKR